MPIVLAVICDSGLNVIEAGTSFDPNARTEPTGVGTQQWISAARPISYSIAFTNEATATLPAQAVPNRKW